MLLSLEKTEVLYFCSLPLWIGCFVLGYSSGKCFIHLYLGFEFQSSNWLPITFLLRSKQLYLMSSRNPRAKISYATILFLLFLQHKGDRKQEKQRHTTSQSSAFCISEGKQGNLSGDKTGAKYLWMCRQMSNKKDSQNQIPVCKVIWEAALSQSSSYEDCPPTWIKS